ncbi:hypothetical protein COY07_03500 [Candidatus Peregrinibacteria bacterium CG_4_10_14_0_2_um_filter_43_11]|nr:MAG: hypothetical protein COY07_03500 [Candidatus Peregrinibacteria bacterium CG_4_10_14_0_2_um_filter_43_11]
MVSETPVPGAEPAPAAESAPLSADSPYRTDYPGKKTGSDETLFVAEAGVNPTLADTLEKVEGLRWVGKLAGNGGRDVAILVPPGYNPDLPTEVVYHFHGSDHTIGMKVPKGGSKGKLSVGEDRFSQVISAAEIRDRSKRNVIVVYPLSTTNATRVLKSHSGNTHYYDNNWMKAGYTQKGDEKLDNMNDLHTQTMTVLQKQLGINPTNIDITFKGHSAGGKPLMNLSSSFTPPSNVGKLRFDFLDASYGNWADTCYRQMTTRVVQVPIEFNLFLIPGAITNASVRRLQNKQGVHVEKANVTYADLVTRYKSTLMEAKYTKASSKKRVAHGDLNATYFNWERSPE